MESVPVRPKPVPIIFSVITLNYAFSDHAHLTLHLIRVSSVQQVDAADNSQYANREGLKALFLANDTDKILNFPIDSLLMK